ncbi:alpha-N-acetyl-neuraminyl-2,3-beta-galactosyl-1,3-N-acetyl-galactosaminide alpha-2,6-sialyltransferase-like [Branchiostoma floridae x Branchiostoma japonicum]
MPPKTKMTLRRLAWLMTSLFLVGFTYVMLRTDRPFIGQHQLSLAGGPGWGSEGHAFLQLNSTERPGITTDLLQNATVKATDEPEPIKNLRPPVEPPVPFDRVNRLRGYVGVPNATKQLSLRCGVCALVSSSGQLLKYEAGNEIDKADCVIRMSDAPVLGFEKHVGSKTALRVSCFQSVYLVPANGNLYGKAGKSALLGWGPAKDMDTKTGKAHLKLKLVSEMNRDLDVYELTQERMDYSGDVFKKETGKSLKASGTWLSTGWFSMLVAMEMCDVIRVYGLSSEDYCRTHPNDTTKYHYYVSMAKHLGTNTKECEYYNWNERTRNGAHRFYTEKSIFARWAPHRNITFHYPSWSP